MLAGTLTWGIALYRARPSDLQFVVADADSIPGRVGEWVAARNDGPRQLSFSDGTRVRLDPEARVRVAAVEPAGARIVLERGMVEASVVHREGSRWIFEVGPFHVVVVGTRFDVSWGPVDEAFRLVLHEGRVQVSGACLTEARTVIAGRDLRVSCRAGSEEVLETDMSISHDPDSGPPSASEASSAGAPPAARATERSRSNSGAYSSKSLDDPLAGGGWRDLAAAGRYADALALVERSGFGEACRRGTGEELLQLGDVARLAGNGSRARDAYLAARPKLVGGGRSAYVLGLTAFDNERDFPTAARWFETYLAEQPAGELRREASARRMEAWQAAGDRDRGRAAARDYLRDYPDGAQAAMARALARP
jgi:hypothetical protein